jgi:hypothetical protein
MVANSASPSIVRRREKKKKKKESEKKGGRQAGLGIEQKHEREAQTPAAGRSFIISRC